MGSEYIVVPFLKKQKKKMKQTGQCRLCLEVKQFAKSHIIPDFYFKRIREGDDKFYTFDAIGAYHGDGNMRYAFSGEYDCNILCENCDNNIGKLLEDYACKLLFGGLTLEVGERAEDFVTPDGISFTRFSNIDYSKYKLFLLSILWRASISTRPFFENVNLGPHEETIRKMLLSHEPGLASDYPTLVLNYLRASDELTKIVGQPLKKRIENRIAYMFIIFGSVITYLISKSDNPPSALFLDSTINPNGEMKWFHVQGDALNFLSRIIGVGK